MYRSKGFTLIELLVAMTILAIAASVGFVTYTSAQIAGRDSKRKQDIRAVSTGLFIFYQQQTPHSYINSGGPVNSTAASWATLFPAPVTDFINIMPTDPTNNATFRYVYTPSGGPPPSSYTLCATLENGNDHDCTSGLGGPTCQFCATNP